MNGAGPRIFLVAGEESGDQLGAALMAAIRELSPNAVFEGLGGGRMAAAGLRPIFPMHEIALMGVAGVLAGLPRILRRIRETAEAVVRSGPDALVIIDSPDFTHRVAKRVRRQAPAIPILDYVSPTVWAWRPWRAKSMRRYIDRVLAVLPFEPEVHKRLGGPPCDYVGHPLIEKLPELRPGPGERPALEQVERPCLLILPGSRRAEVSRLLEPFGRTLTEIVARRGEVEAIIPAVPHLAATIREAVKGWPIKPEIVEGEPAKFRAFRRAHAALAASGTATLELALAGVPLAVAYKVESLLRPFKWVVKVPSIVLPNLILGQNVIPEFLDERASPEILGGAVLPLLADTPARQAQVDAFARLDGLMQLERGAPSGRAAEIVVSMAEEGRRPG